ncbi:MAG: hypothetical protein P4M07_08190 [Xanthobacteraceae bacterium]|nr:hypothetical protein [Xanthobacteraceae bacterium]
MTIVSYTCPIKGAEVYVWFDQDISPYGDRVYEPVQCPLCGEIHFVDRDGNVFGYDEDVG